MVVLDRSCRCGWYAVNCEGLLRKAAVCDCTEINRTARGSIDFPLGNSIALFDANCRIHICSSYKSVLCRLQSHPERFSKLDCIDCLMFRYGYAVGTSFGKSTSVLVCGFERRTEVRSPSVLQSRSCGVMFGRDGNEFAFVDDWIVRFRFESLLIF